MKLNTFQLKDLRTRLLKKPQAEADKAGQKAMKESLARAKRDEEAWNRDCRATGSGRNAMSAPPPLDVDEGERIFHFARI